MYIPKKMLDSSDEDDDRPKLTKDDPYYKAMIEKFYGSRYRAFKQ